MSNTRLSLLATAVLALAGTGALAAGNDSASLLVSASVSAKCKVTLDQPMAFGALDPTVSTDATKVVTASYQCTKGTTVLHFTVANLAASPYSGSMLPTPLNGDSIPYTVSWTPPPAFTGAGLGTSKAKQDVTLTGFIANADYIDVKPDVTYQETIAIGVDY